jgi:F-type H+-transporting ATPase subunit epsilon
MLTFSLSKVNRIIFEGEVISVTAPGSAGELTILKGHTPLITTLKKGIVKVRTKKESEENDLLEFEIDGGLLETSGNNTTILV